MRASEAVLVDADGPSLAPAQARPWIVAILASYNRQALTLGCLEALKQSADDADVVVEAILVDDASPDGTARAVRERFAWVQVVEGSGTLFWNRAMHKGFALAMQRPADHYLWLNDDTLLNRDAIGRLLRQVTALRQDHGRPLILVGATADPNTGVISYGGRVRDSRLRPFHYRLVWHADEPVPCHVMEGNCVLIPREVARRVGNLDPFFEHAMGDTDYALRARRAGVDLFVSGGVVGVCSRNPKEGSYADRRVPFRHRWQMILGKKGLPVRSWMHFCRRHGGPLWPLHFAWPYTKLMISGLRALLEMLPFEL